MIVIITIIIMIMIMIKENNDCVLQMIKLNQHMKKNEIK